ncbi:type VI secretion system tube protein Hcp [Thalassomonas viridans]|uniref:Type VI secretion system tube protein Hcp n=1 Tax=Thalassomonas viridans TaxID=137584 RepID=A0AAE9Z3E3_9GAMM|nr:type VI secretion system tube protein Hcp [Thalassomonas viridans]WDE05329.1 type VI secretion system tube protein Hcp [Thalassomonas viridans]
MASIYMRIDGNDTIKGSATVTDIGGKKGFFALESTSWSAMRNVSVDIGNADNNDGGMVALGEIQCSKQLDGASPFITTFLFSPGEEGKKIEIVFTKPDRGGKGLIPYLIVTLENARISSYSVSGSDGSQPGENFAMTYSTIAQTYYVESEGGKVEKAAEVAFNTQTAEITSQADLK